MNVINWLVVKVKRQYIRIFKFPKVYKIGKKFKVASVQQTINSLINSNKSLSRFGDGELGWLCGKNILPKSISYEYASKELRNKLKQVITSTNPNLEIGLSPINESKDHHYNIHCRRDIKVFMSKLGLNWMKYLNVNKQYYNTNITRAYSSYKNYSYSRHIFSQLKKIWKNKDILIIEGQGTRLGVNNNLFSGAKSICRIECPSKNSFESYSSIKDIVYKVIHKCNSINLILLALGPTATVLAYDLSNNGYRAIDVGHVDIEYEWFLRDRICNIPYKRVNEVPGGQSLTPISDRKYKNEIVAYVK